MRRLCARALLRGSGNADGSHAHVATAHRRCLLLAVRSRESLDFDGLARFRLLRGSGGGCELEHVDAPLCMLTCAAGDPRGAMALHRRRQGQAALDAGHEED